MKRACTISGKARVVPAKLGRGNPLCFACVPRVLHHDAHAMAAIIVIRVAHYPATRAIHLHYGRDALAGADPEKRYRGGVRDRIAIKSNYPEGMAGQSKTTSLGGAAVQNMKQDALTLLYP